MRRGMEGTWRGRFAKGGGFRWELFTGGVPLGRWEEGLGELQQPRCSLAFFTGQEFSKFFAGIASRVWTSRVVGGHVETVS
jgi:hypothetical protein